MVKELQIEVQRPGLHEFTRQVEAIVLAADVSEGLCTIYIPHTSASLTLQENADPAVQRDLEAWFNRLVPPDDSLYTHTAEGPDDMPAHIKSALTTTSLSIPIVAGRLVLGTWQGIYLWEHRGSARRRRIYVHLGP